jgi:hypothetical protein
MKQVFALVERLRKEAIGEPSRIREKGAFEYQEQSAKVVAGLKLVRMAQGVAAMKLLCQSGLFVDCFTIARSVYDCEMEIYFLLETFPATSGNVEQFLANFFESTIDGFLAKRTPPVPTQKIKAAMVRVFKGNEQFREMIDHIYKTFSGYVHANYSHVMQMYNGGARDFNLAGVPSAQQRSMNMERVDLATTSVLRAAAFIADRLGLTDLHRDILAHPLWDAS